MVSLLFSMQLIPEYDPEKYVSPKQEKVDVVRDVKKDEDEEVMRTNEHYSGSYLDTYTDLMDIPYDDEDGNGGNDDIDDKDNSEKERGNPESLQTYQQLINMGFNEDVAIIASQKYPNDMNKAITFITLTSQQESETNANKVEVNDNEDEQDEQDAQDEIGEEYKNEDDNDKEEDEDTKNSIISFMKQMDKKFDAFSKDLKAHIDDKCFLLEKRIGTLERTNSKFEEKLKSQQERIESLENIDNSNNINNNRSRTSSGYTIPSTTVIPRKSIEEKSNQDTSSTTNASKPTSIIPSLTSKPTQQPFIHKTILSPSPYPTNTSFTDSTIGSSALGMSLTPNPTRTNSVLLNGSGNGVGSGIRTQPRIGMTTNNRNIISGQLRTTQSPFIGSQSYNYTAYQPSQPSMTHVTGIQAMSGINSGGNGSLDVRSDPDNTMEFIADLKRMLNSTDALLKSNREERKGLGLYDANI